MPGYHTEAGRAAVHLVGLFVDFKTHRSQYGSEIIILRQADKKQP